MRNTMKVFVILFVVWGCVLAQEQIGGVGDRSRLRLPSTPKYREGNLVAKILRVRKRRLFLEGDIAISQKDEASISRIYKIGRVASDKKDVSPNRPPVRKRRNIKSAEVKAITNNHHIEKRSVIWIQNKLWPVGTDGLYKIPYYFDSSLSTQTKTLFASAVDIIDKNTLIRFEQIYSEYGDYIKVFHQYGYGCWSDLGRRGGQQELSLQSGHCDTVGIILHELLHAVGFFHEHSRSDRNDYVNVEWNKIEYWAEPNFYRRSMSLSQGTPYDFDSIMHYKLDDFTIQPGENTLQPTIAVGDPNEIGNKVTLSTNDITQLNAVYVCTAGVTNQFPDQTCTNWSEWICANMPSKCLRTCLC